MMLRGRISPQRPPFICAFCQHQQFSRLPRGARRLLSSTRRLCDQDSSAPIPDNDVRKPATDNGSLARPGGWGKPSFGSFSTRPDSSTVGQQQSAPVLNEFELEARRRLGAQRQAAEANHSPPGAVRKPPIAAKYIWNEDVQRRIEASLPRHANGKKKTRPLVHSKALPKPTLPEASLDAPITTPTFRPPVQTEPLDGKDPLGFSEISTQAPEPPKTLPLIPPALKKFKSPVHRKALIGKFPMGSSESSMQALDTQTIPQGFRQPVHEKPLISKFFVGSSESSMQALNTQTIPQGFRQPVHEKSLISKFFVGSLETHAPAYEAGAYGSRPASNQNSMSRRADRQNPADLPSSFQRWGDPGGMSPYIKRRDQLEEDNSLKIPALKNQVESPDFFRKQPQTPAPLSAKSDSFAFGNGLSNNQDSSPSLFSGNTKAESLLGDKLPCRTTETPAPTTSSISRPSGLGLDNSTRPVPRDANRQSREMGGWGSLVRKPTPEKSNSDAFWDTLESDVLGTNRSAPKPTRQSSWSTPLHQPAENQNTSLRRKQMPENRDARSTRKNQERKPQTWPASDDWGAADGNENRVRKQRGQSSVDDWSGRSAEQTPAPSSGNVINTIDYGGQSYGTERAGGRKERGKRGGGERSSRWAVKGEEDNSHNVYEEYLQKKKEKALRKAHREAERAGPIPILLPELINISSLASALKVETGLFLEQLAELGFDNISLESIMAGETAALVAQEYGYEPTVETGASRDIKPRPPPEDLSLLPPRPPVVTIMGHVDHGKTTLLDYLRKSSVAAQEHGGITQHIGAFSVKMSTGKQITFLDTPGHAAFLTMRQRGANVTDIVILVVAADDSVKPQTLEALKHARTSGVPIIVAINKIDKEGARVEQVKGDLARHGVEIEDFGGDVQVVCVSGKTGEGMADLEENILTLAEILDMRAEADGPAEGWILESTLKPMGKAATILVKRGTMRPGDYIAAGTTWAKIRSLRNEAGVEIQEAPPGTPVEILGWKSLPAAGDQVIQAPDEGRAKDAATYREGLKDREKDAADHEKIAEQRKAVAEQRRLVIEQREAAKRANDKTASHKREFGTWGTTEQFPEEEGGPKKVNFVVKGDVHGSVEAVCASILEIGSHEVQPRILRSLPGHITESDVEHAATSSSTIVNFNLPVTGIIKRLAEDSGVRILDHSVIYHLADAVKALLSEHLEDSVSSKVLGEAEILQVFPINIKGRVFKNIAGCRIRNGKVDKNDMFRVFRGTEMIHEGKLQSLKHGKKEVPDARKGGECGMEFELFQDLKVGDQIQAFEEIRTPRTL